MAFPTSPISGQIAVVNNIAYSYNTTLNAWFRTAPTSANIITTDTANVVSNTTSTSTTTGALKVAGGVGVVGNIYAGNFFYANGAAVSGAGSVGYTGSAGSGYTGSAGTAGSAGSTGYTGSQGAAGNTGTTGYTGSVGTFSGTTSSTIVTTNSTASTSTSTGALQVSGGAGIAGNVYASSVYTNGLYWSGNGAVISTGGGGTTGGYLNMVMTGAVLPPISGTARMYPPVDLTITKVMANLSAPPSNGNLTFVIKKNGSSLGATYTLSTALMDPVTVSIALTTADYLTIDVFGSTTAADLHVKLKYV